MARPSLALNDTDATFVAAFAAMKQRTPLWLYDFENYAIVWANTAALALWEAECVTELAARSLRAEMSDGVAGRLDQYKHDFRANPDHVITESWTVYPRGAPVLLDAECRWCPLSDGRAAMLIEARRMDYEDPDTLRGLDALLHSQVMTAVYAMDGHELFANRALRKAIGSTPWPFGHGFVDRGAHARFMERIDSGDRYREIVQVRTLDGLRWYDIQAGQCRDAATGASAFTISATDVTTMREGERQLRDARDRAHNADRAKSEFVASMSHEMRTPMNGILGLVELLSRSDLTVAQRQQLETMRDSGIALLHLIEGVLDLSSIELGSLQLKPTPVDIGRTARAVVDGLRPPAEAKGLRLLLEVSRDLPAIAICDGHRLAQLMRNLIGNAIKFTTEGWVLLSLSPGAEHGLLIEVIDTGPGVPKAERATIFDKFQQGHNARHPGVGLGLAICREITSVFNGQIGVEEAHTKGARFWIRLPYTFPAAGLRTICAAAHPS